MSTPLVLIIEDDAMLGDMFATALQTVDYSTEIVRDGLQALSRLDEITPHLIVLDLNLPRVSGLELLNHIRQNKRLKGVWVMVASANQVQTAFVQDRVDDHLFTLHKPVNVREFIQLAQRLKP